MADGKSPTPAFNKWMAILPLQLPTGTPFVGGARSMTSINVPSHEHLSANMLF